MAVFPSGEPPVEKREILETWIKRPLIPRQYDTEVVEMLMHVFLRHVSGVFASFVDFTVSSYTLAVQPLAMAAAGALFSKCPGSAVVARMYYTDTQLMLTYHLLDDPERTDIQRSISILQTYIALEIFGLCSGYKRADEISEGYHTAFLEILEEHQALLDTKDASTDLKKLSTNVYHDYLIIQGYRATLRQLQPMFINPHFQSIYAMLHTLVGDEGNSQPLERNLFHSLGGLCAMSWFTADPTTNSSLSSVGQFWRQETIERYSEILFTTHRLSFTSSPSSKVLLFTNLLAIHAPLEQFQDVAHSLLELKTGTHLDQCNRTQLHHLRMWKQGNSYNLALKYAYQVLEAAEYMYRDEVPGTYNEAPHDAICVYLASLVCEISRILCGKESKGHRVLSEKSMTGIYLLEKFQVRISRLLRAILLSLRTRSYCDAQ